MHLYFLVQSISVRLILKTFLLAVAIIFSPLALTTTFAQTPPADASLLANSVYLKNCAKCHGKTAEGRHFGGPSLLSQKAAAAAADDTRNIIANGKGHMPKFAGKLTPEEIDTLVKQIQALKK
jgi:mono/diheme cytochrome c family protein